jgi:hypothetical protein
MMEASLFETEVLPRLEAKRAEWLSGARAVARQLGRKGPTNINDVRRLCPLPPGVDPRVMGAVFNKSEWVCVGYKRSSRSTCHNRPIGTFVLRDPLKNL